jgi:hypothetical protein
LLTAILHFIAHSEIRIRNLSKKVKITLKKLAFIDFSYGYNDGENKNN